MKNNEINQKFLSVITPEARHMILSTIAKHYGVALDVIFDELVDEDAEHILDYMVDRDRAAASILLRKHGLWVY